VSETGAPVAPEKSRRFPLHLQIIAAMAVGLVVGPLLGKDASALGEIGKVVIDLIKAAATPLLFFAIVNAILKTEVPPGKAWRLAFWASVNACIALTIGLLLSNLFLPGRTLAGFAPPDGAAASTYANKKIDLLGTLTGFIPTNVVTPFQQNLVLSVIFLALFLGFGLRRVRTEQLARGSTAHRPIEEGVETLLRLTEIVLAWVIKLIPLAVFGVVARAVGEHGYGPLKGLFAYVLVGLGGLVLHIGITYHLELLLLARMPLRVFWRAAKEPVIYAAGANSSLATLPVTLRALDRLGVSRSASVLGAGIGTNFNNDGIILYEGMALLFVAQAAGIDLSLWQQLIAAAACLVTAMGVAGIPEAGFISLALVLNTVGLPIEILPLLLTTDWIIARGRSVTNVLSDMMLSILIDRSNNRGTATARAPGPP
jgi:Na+/H+-dicarboxylate symporter